MTPPAPRTRAGRAILILALGAMCPVVSAQRLSPGAERGIAAYNALDLVGAVVELRRELDAASADDLPDAVRANLLGYLGAAEFLIGHVPAGREAFWSALEYAPAFRLDTLLFPPLLTHAFHEVRATTLFVGVTMERSGAPGPGAAISLESSFPHWISVFVVLADGVSTLGIYDGPIEERLRVTWPNDARSIATTANAVAIELVSLSADHRMRRLRLPLTALQPELAGLPARPTSSGR